MTSIRCAGSQHRSFPAKRFCRVFSTVGEALVDFVTRNDGKVQGVSVIPMGDLGYGLVANQVRHNFVTEGNLQTTLLIER